jgi:hypothetical protein
VIEIKKKQIISLINSKGETKINLSVSEGETEGTERREKDVSI